MIRGLCPLDGVIRAASGHLHSQRMLISYWFPRTTVCDDGLDFMVVAVRVMVSLQVPSLEREALKGVFHCILH